MKMIKQHFYSDDDPRTIDFYKTHYYSETGHFEYKSGVLAGKPCGIHIELGTSSRITKYVEVDDGEQRSVPDTLPDAVIHIPTEEELKAEEEARKKRYEQETN